MNVGSSMHALDGWVEVDCREADRIRGAQPVKPVSSLTDMGGAYGRPVIYTEWADQDEQPVLRDYLWEPLVDLLRRCEHYRPEAAS